MPSHFAQLVRGVRPPGRDSADHQRRSQNLLGEMASRLVVFVLVWHKLDTVSDQTKRRRLQHQNSR